MSQEIPCNSLRKSINFLTFRKKFDIDNLKTERK